jgi:tetratricopeptide (TPR) repeat protein
MSRDGERCKRCGGSSVDGHCPECDDWRVRFVHREVVLLSVLIALTVVVYGLTQAAASSNRDMHRADAVVRFQQGEEAQRLGDLGSAITWFREAVADSPDDRGYRLTLAAALASGQLDDEAERVLLELRERLPEDPEVSLQLARIEARRFEGAGARRYYQNALASLWTSAQGDERRQVRIELIQFLLNQGERTRALSELLALTPEVAGDADLQVQAGQLLLEAGDARLALDMFAPVVDDRPSDQEALAGAGEAAYRLREYADADRYLAGVSSPAEPIADIRAVTDLILNADPLAPRLGATERRRRLSMIVTQALHRSDECAAPPEVTLLPEVSLPPEVDAAAGVESEVAPEPESELASLWDASELLLSRLAARRPQPRDGVEDGLELARRLEQLAAGACGGAGEPLDRAIVQIAARHGLESE